jgi:hypothetical protein
MLRTIIIQKGDQSALGRAKRSFNTLFFEGSLNSSSGSIFAQIDELRVEGWHGDEWKAARLNLTPVAHGQSSERHGIASRPALPESVL